MSADPKKASPRDALLASFVAGITALPMSAGERQGMGVLFPPVPCEGEGGEAQYLGGLFLAEGPDGKPFALYLSSERETGEPTYDPEAPKPVDMAYGWTDGSGQLRALLARSAVVKEFTYETRRAIEARIAEAVAAALPDAGFTPAFVEALGLATWLRRPPHNAYADYLFRHDATGARMRALTAAHPFATMLAWRDACNAALAGEIDTTRLFRGLAPARLDRLRGPGWNTLALSVSKPLSDQDEPDREARDLLDFLGAVPIDWVPEDIEARFLVMAFRLARAAVEPTGRSVMDLLASSKGQWSALSERLEPKPNPSISSPDAYATYLRDPVRDIAHSLVTPALSRLGIEAMHPGQVFAIASRLLYGDKSLPGCVETSVRWHRHIHAIQGLKPDGHDPDAPWDRPIRDWTFRLKDLTYRVVYLNTRRALREEGAPGLDRNGVAGLDHCVASYHADARSGLTHIVSFRRDLPGGGYERLATAEVKARRLGTFGMVRPLPHVTQFSGARNGAPDPNVHAVLDWWFKDRGNAHGRRMARAAWRLRRSGGDRLRSLGQELCGYDWRVDAQVRDALAAYAFLLPRDLREWPAFEARVAELAGVAGSGDDLLRRPAPRPTSVRQPRLDRPAHT